MPLLRSDLPLFHGPRLPSSPPPFPGRHAALRRRHSPSKRSSSISSSFVFGAWPLESASCFFSSSRSCPFLLYLLYLPTPFYDTPSCPTEPTRPLSHDGYVYRIRESDSHVAQFLANRKCHLFTSQLLSSCLWNVSRSFSRGRHGNRVLLGRPKSLFRFYKEIILHNNRNITKLVTPNSIK